MTSAKVKDGSLNAADLKPGLLLKGPAGPAGTQGPAVREGDHATALWGLVGPSGVKKASGITGTVMTGAGTLRVTFNRDVSQCAVVATPIRSSVTISAGVSTNSNNDVIVYSIDDAGHVSDVSIAAFC